MRDKKAIFYQVVVPGLVAIFIGFLEAAWTRVESSSPVNTWLGVFAILGILSLVSFPRLWRIPALAIIEEATHGLAQNLVGIPWVPTWNTIFAHWSTNFVGMNIYPWILFPVLTIIGELIYRRLNGKRLSLQMS